MEQILEGAIFLGICLGICLGMYFAAAYPMVLNKGIDGKSTQKSFEDLRLGFEEGIIKFIFVLFVYIYERLQALVITILVLVICLPVVLFLPLVLFFHGDLNFKKNEDE